MAEQRRGDLPSVADAMWPSLSRQAKAKEAEEAKQRAWRERDSQRLAQLLRETRESMRADREKKR
jgi:hypothetical protein